MEAATPVTSQLLPAHQSPLGTGTASTGQPVRTDTGPAAKQYEAQAVAAVIERLAKKFADSLRTRVEEIVSEEYTALNDGPIGITCLC
ncbi:three-helix bundle dimerization domain-containing protein [Paenarthrobacter sp. AMU7]|uniref:Three-helix bundle dimerization domain-containing protein n=1 Tax=Paenarthrobacter sp. AMU7 TaxID=3162492 RepID=A0AB39YPG4_9MICC